MFHCTQTRRHMLKLLGASALTLVAGCDDVLDVDLVSEERVRALGLRAWSEIRGRTPVAHGSEAQTVLDGVATRLLSAAGQARRDWEVLVFASPEINAFALPGNKIGVFEGMFRVAANEDQLATVVGHEIGHLQADHGQERINAQVAKDWGLQAVSLLLQIGEIEYAREIAAALGVGVEYGLVLPYSRRQELKADRLGIGLMASAGFAPDQAVALWTRMDAVGGPRPPNFLATHPAPRARIEEIREMIANRQG